MRQTAYADRPVDNTEDARLRDVDDEPVQRVGGRSCEAPVRLSEQIQDHRHAIVPNSHDGINQELAKGHKLGRVQEAAHAVRGGTDRVGWLQDAGEHTANRLIVARVGEQAPFARRNGRHTLTEYSWR